MPPPVARDGGVAEGREGEMSEQHPYVLYPHGVGRGCKGLKPQHHTLSLLMHEHEPRQHVAAPS